MKKKNIFDGNSCMSIFASISYRLLMTGEWISHTQVMNEYKVKYGREKDYDVQISKSPQDGDLRKAFPRIISLLRDTCGESIIEEVGSNRGGKLFRYVGTDKDPLADLRNAVAIKDLKRYAQFCEDTSGLLPKSWLEYFFKGTYDLLTIKEKKQKGQELISCTLNNTLSGVELLPKLYEDIKARKKLKITYKRNKDNDILIFSPYYLREFNGRWHLFGNADGKQPAWVMDLALDRITHVESTTESIVEVPSDVLMNFFKHKIGTSRSKHNPEGIVSDVVIRIHTSYMYNIVTSKPFMPPPLQEVLTPYGTYEGNNYGEIMLHVEVNDEMIGKVLQLGPELEVMSPVEIRRLFARRIEAMNNRYLER